ncbi:hypothetical protein F5Y16DRAFT_420273 [Xylariaceae sp. FL0255]|nr:hypothetical protein F5Y16DRAFT_420273 [Xylariaceae sp. FL0255]
MTDLRQTHSDTTKNSSQVLEDLTTDLTLHDNSETLTLLRHPEVKELFRHFSNRCLSPGHLSIAKLPDWKDVDEHIYKISLSSVFRQQLLANTGGQLRTLDTSIKTHQQTHKLLETHFERQAYDLPYEYLPHVCLFVLRLTRFFETGEDGQRCFVYEPQNAITGKEPEPVLRDVAKSLNLGEGKMRELELRRRSLIVLRGLLLGLDQ